eukprot:TRINITY_DN2325_c0_g1_i8.p3 TRINITY_DN2325_c0_g1~~TRINITY_DN2325_c0_g1_i8.p3  ORF type:complete len:173 (+),score=43.79 TRINITY_DN2325_c0_g1_i8:206-724(+)
MKKETIRYIVGALAIMGCVSSIPQSVFAHNVKSINNIAYDLNYKSTECSKCKKNDKDEKKESIFNEGNEKYLTKEQAKEWKDIKKYKDNGKELTKEQKEFLNIVLDCIIKGKLGDKNYKEYKELLSKKQSGKTLSDEENKRLKELIDMIKTCLLYTSPSPRDRQKSRMPSSA